MANIFELVPCESPADMVTSIIQTRIFTTTGPMEVDCSGVTSLDDQASCNIWGNALQSLSPVPCSGDPGGGGGGGGNPGSSITLGDLFHVSLLENEEKVYTIDIPPSPNTRTLWGEVINFAIPGSFDFCLSLTAPNACDTTGSIEANGGVWSTSYISSNLEPMATGSTFYLTLFSSSSCHFDLLISAF